MSNWYLIHFKNFHTSNAFTAVHDAYQADNPRLAIAKARSECAYRFELVDIKKIEGVSND